MVGLPTKAVERGLPELARELERLVLQLEEALLDDHLQDCLTSCDAFRANFPGVIEAFQAASSATPAILEVLKDIHRTAAPALLEVVANALREPDVLFSAEPLRQEPKIDGEASGHFGIGLKPPHDSIRMRRGQVASARYWGIGFQFDDPAAAAEVDAFIAKLVIQHFSSNVASLRRIAEYMAATEKTFRSMAMVSPKVGRDFEQLVIDVLNEGEPVAHRANLFEDFVEKTDVRVALPNLDRRRGARVQVTRMLNASALEEKQASMRHREEIVLVAPGTLADSLFLSGVFNGEERAEFLLNFKGRTKERVANELWHMFADAVARGGGDPRGPMAFLPASIREFIRAYVEREGVRTTMEVRRRIGTPTDAPAGG